MKFHYIYQLPLEKSNAIYNEVRNSLLDQGLKGEELTQSLDDAICSRLIDLEDTINISNYL